MQRSRQQSSTALDNAQWKWHEYTHPSFLLAYLECTKMPEVQKPSCKHQATTSIKGGTLRLREQNDGTRRCLKIPRCSCNSAFYFLVNYVIMWGSHSELLLVGRLVGVPSHQSFPRWRLSSKVAGGQHRGRLSVNMLMWFQNKEWQWISQL